MLAELRDLCQTLTTRLKEHEETCMCWCVVFVFTVHFCALVQNYLHDFAGVELETAKLRLLQAERVAHEKVGAEQRALQRIKALEANFNTLQAQKDQVARLNEQLMRQKVAVEERLRETKLSTVAQGSQHQDIVFYKNKVRWRQQLQQRLKPVVGRELRCVMLGVQCIELQQENALLRQASKGPRPTLVQVERHSNTKLSSGATQQRKHKRL